jgi:hypothetical protein
MFEPLLSFRSARLGPLGLAVAVAFSAQQTVALAASPFQKFAGEWRGAGEIVESNGHRELIRCRAEYAEAKDGSALNRAIVCASESFKLDIKSYVEASGDSIQGYWSETARDLNGHLTGRIAEGRFEGEISAPAFTAAISLTANGHSQAVSIKPRGGDVSDVRIELKRNG